jgi:hypothetical protein
LSRARFAAAAAPAAWLVALLAAGCDGATADPGLDAWLRVDRGQRVAAPEPGDEGGPRVTALQLLSTTVTPGQPLRTLQGTATLAAHAVAIGLEGDSGYWVIKPGSVDPITGALTFTADLSFSTALPTGDRLLWTRGVAADGRAGPRTTQLLHVVTDQALGALVVSLSWSNNADLDLHVVDPDGVEIWARQPTSYMPPAVGTAVDPDALARAGVLDVDSNAGCIEDGRRQENVVWKTEVPRGHLIIRVDAASLCGEVESAYRVEVRERGQVIARAQGVALQVDADRSTHDRGSGLTVLELDVP